MNENNTIAVVGAGISGLAVAIALRNIGVNVEIFEQAAAFKRIGAAINMTPTPLKYSMASVLENLFGKPLMFRPTGSVACGILERKHPGWNWVI